MLPEPLTGGVGVAVGRGVGVAGGAVGVGAADPGLSAIATPE